MLTRENKKIIDPRRIPTEGNFLRYDSDDRLFGLMYCLASFDPTHKRLYLMKKNYTKNKDLFYQTCEFNDKGTPASKTLKRHLDKLIEKAQEAAERAVQHNDCGAQEHGGHVVHAEHGGEQLAARRKAGSGIGDKEDDNDNGRNQGERVALVPEALGEKLGNGNGMDALGVDTQTLGNQQPVEICADSQTDGSPRRLRKTRHQRKTGQAHQKPAAHVRRLRTHRRDERTELSAAEIEILGALVFLGCLDTDADHHTQVQHDGNRNDNICGVEHTSSLLFAKLLSNHTILPR